VPAPLDRSKLYLHCTDCGEVFDPTDTVELITAYNHDLNERCSGAMKVKPL